MNILSPTGRIIFWVLFAAAAGISCATYCRFFHLILLGRAEKLDGSWWKRTEHLFLYVAGQWSTLKNVSARDLSGVFHFFIFWGVVLFLINYAYFLFLGEGLAIWVVDQHALFSRLLRFMCDIAGILLLVSMIASLVRRIVTRPARLGPNFDIGIFLAVVLGSFFLLLLHYGSEGLRICLGQSQLRTPVAGLFADFFRRLYLNPTELQTLAQILFWCQYLLILGFVAYAPHSHHKHPLFSPINIFFRSLRRPGALMKIDLEEGQRLGASGTKELTRRQLLNGFACAHCGRCQDDCPAYETGKPLSPKQVLLEVNQDLITSRHCAKDDMNGKADNFSKRMKESILSCTACGACIERCPVFNRPLDTIIELRRGLVYDGIFEAGQQTALTRIARDYNPWGVRWNRRTVGLPRSEEAQKGKKIECLYWLGCTASSDDRAKGIARATMKILSASGIAFATLGSQEKCCGDFPRRVGDEGLFQQLAAENISLLQGFDFDFILVHCPHCYNVLSNEYREMGGDFRVVHHSSLIAELLRQGRISLQDSRPQFKAAYHDPCYLGRYNGLYDEPRTIINELFGNVIEWDRNRNRAFCCGAGGGHMWKEQETGERMSIRRIDDMVTFSPDFIATSCPFCLLMFEEAIQIKSKSEELKVRDIAELVEAFMH